MPNVSRETFAVFMEPSWEEPMNVPQGVRYICLLMLFSYSISVFLYYSPTLLVSFNAILLLYIFLLMLFSYSISVF
jgi:hypothetical protein